MTEAEWAVCENPLRMLHFLAGRASVRKRQLFALACYKRSRELLGPLGQRCLGSLQEALEDDEWLGAGKLHEETWGDLDEDLARCFWGWLPLGGRFSRDIILQDAIEQHSEMDLTDWGDGGAVAAGATMVTCSEAVNQGCVRSLDVLEPVVNAIQLAARIAENAQAAGPEPYRVWVSYMRLFAELIRDLFGNPFRSAPSFAPAVLQWNDRIVKRLAEEASEHRLMPAGTLNPERLAVLADALEEAGCTASEVLGHLRDPGPHWRGCHIVDLLLGKS